MTTRSGPARQPSKVAWTAARAPPARNVTAHRQAQSRFGNAGTSALLMQRDMPPVRPKLEVGRADDPLEHEADRVADNVVRMKAGGECASCAMGLPCEGCGGETVRRAGDGSSSGSPVPPHAASGIERSTRGGEPLPGPIRASMEPRFGADFSAVRIHRDAAAGDSAKSIGARAYTVGNHIAFGHGQWSPGTSSGDHLIAHELTHTLQEGGGTARTLRRGLFGDDDAPQSEEVEDQPFTLDGLFDALGLAARLFPSLAPLAAMAQLVRGLMVLWQRRQELFNQLLDAIGQRVGEVPALAQTKMNEAVAKLESSGFGTAAEAVGCVFEQLGSILVSLAENWREVIISFLRDMLVIGLIERSLPTIFGNLPDLFTDLIHGDFRAATDRGVLIMTEINAIIGVAFLWFALITTILGAAAGSEVPAAGNAAGAAVGLTAAEAVGIALVTSVIVTETIRVARGIDDMSRFWDVMRLRVAACRDVAEGIFAIALTLILFFLGPGIQRIARAIIQRAAMVVRAVVAGARALATEGGALGAPVLVGPGGVAFKGVPPVPDVNPGGLRPPVSGGGGGRPGAITGETPPRTGRPGAELERPTASDRRLGAAAASATEAPERRARDACQVRFGLNPGSNARYIEPRSPINGHTTVSLAAFRLDAGRPPPTGGDTTPESRQWVRQIGCPSDDAGHVIANRFGGFATHNRANGNIFPQDLTFNRGEMNRLDGVAEQHHREGCDVCVLIQLSYEPDTSLRPTHALYIYQYRRPGSQLFNPPIPAVVRNESRDPGCTA